MSHEAGPAYSAGKADGRRTRVRLNDFFFVDRDRDLRTLGRRPLPTNPVLKECHFLIHRPIHYSIKMRE